MEDLEADVVIFDDELSPRHQRELEKAFGEDVKVIDRPRLFWISLPSMHKPMKAAAGGAGSTGIPVAAIDTHVDPPCAPGRRPGRRCVRWCRFAWPW
ncbi:MAG: hypothetical protein R3C44_04900 [Chloroflexota bacterium]